ISPSDHAISGRLQVRRDGAASRPSAMVVLLKPSPRNLCLYAGSIRPSAATGSRRPLAAILCRVRRAVQRQPLGVVGGRQLVAAVLVSGEVDGLGELPKCAVVLDMRLLVSGHACLPMAVHAKR